LSRLEEVLVITQQEEKQPSLADGAAPIRAADILAQRLPSVPDRPPDDPNKPPPPTSGLKILPAPTTQAPSGSTVSPKPSGGNASSPSAGPSRLGQSRLGQSMQGQGPGQTSTTSVIPKPHADSAGSASTPGSVSSATRQTGNPPAVKPPSAQKSAAPAVKIPDVTNAAPDSQSKPVSPKPDAPSKQPVTEPAPPQEQPQ
jgi:hypothetical protein